MNKFKKSFEQWCLDNNQQDVLDHWDYELNLYKPSEIAYATNKKYYFKCHKGLHKSELKRISNITKGIIGSTLCKQCNSFAQWGIDNLGDDFLELYWDYDKNIGVNPWEIVKSANNKMWIKCQEKEYHGSYIISLSDFYRSHRCPYCVGKKVHPLDSLGTLFPQVLEIWSDKNKKSPYEYTPNTIQKVWWKCIDGIHSNYLRSISVSNKYKFRCPECVKERDESFLQEKVRLYLKSLNNENYTILHEHKCTIVPKNPKTKMNLPFDNEVKELKLIIEVHGLQHYIVTTWHKHLAKHNNTTPEQELHYQQLKDRYKRIFAKQQGYFYVEIPYWTDDKDETWKKLINNKIEEILNKFGNKSNIIN